MKSHARNMQTGALRLSLAAALGLSCSDKGTRPTGLDASSVPAAASVVDTGEGVVAMFVSPQIDARAFARNFISTYGGTIRFVFEQGTRGFSAILPRRAVAVLRSDPAIRFVEPIRWVDVADHITQLSPPWGLDRIDQRTLPLDSRYYYGDGGTGVTVYVIDTGILTTHTQFGGRAVVGWDVTGGNGQDCIGHGTHVAGIIGASTYGAAKQVHLVAVRVIDCDPNTKEPADRMMAGIDSVLAHRVTPAVANISLTVIDTLTGRRTPDAAVDAKVADLVAAGITVVVAAGNDSADACQFSPGRVASAITVGATTNTDAKAAFSDFGSCVDLFAPGQDMTSTWWTSNTATAVLSGTSMAAPAVSGVAALYLQRIPGAPPSNVASAISSRATQNALTNVGTGSPNLLLYTQFNDASISGPSTMNCIDTYTWSATASGVGGSFTYVWQQGSPTGLGNGMIWTQVGTGPSYSRQGCPGEAYLWLRVNATDEFGFHRLAYQTVTLNR